MERRIREAQERGEFDDLPGAEKPLAGLDGPYDELWWVKSLMRREGLSYLPPALALRKEAEEIRQGLQRLPSEEAVRRIVREHNARIVEAIRGSHGGPAVVVAPLDAEEAVQAWRDRRAVSAPTSPAATADMVGGREPGRQWRRPSWLRRWRDRRGSASRARTER